MRLHLFSITIAYDVICTEFLNTNSMIPDVTKVRACLMICLTVLLLLSIIEGFAQQSDKVMSSSVLNPNRLSITNVVLKLPVSEEKTFWAIYEEYIDESEKTIGLNSLNRLMTRAIDVQTFNFLDSLLANRNQELALRQQYFEKICKAINGRVGIQFLQTEELLDLIVMSEYYEKLPWSSAFLSHDSDPTKITEVLLKELSMESNQSENFVYLYEAFQYESSATWGDELSWFEQYIEDVSDQTPAQAYAMGKEFIRLQQREVKVKNKYFVSIRKIADAETSAQLMAWEDYRSIIGKIKAWSNSSLFTSAEIARGD